MSPVTDLTAKATVIMTSALKTQVLGVCWKDYDAQLVLAPVSPQMKRLLEAPVPAPISLYVRRADGTVKYRIPCDGVKVTVHSASGKPRTWPLRAKFEFQVTHSSGISMAFRVSSQVLLDQWVAALQLAARSIVRPFQPWTLTKLKNQANNGRRPLRLMEMSVARDTVPAKLCVAARNLSASSRCSVQNAAIARPVIAAKPFDSCTIQDGSNDCGSFRSETSSTASIRPSVPLLSLPSAPCSPEQLDFVTLRPTIIARFLDNDDDDEPRDPKLTDNEAQHREDHDNSVPSQDMSSVKAANALYPHKQKDTAPPPFVPIGGVALAFAERLRVANEMEKSKTKKSTAPPSFVPIGGVAPAFADRLCVANEMEEMRCTHKLLACEVKPSVSVRSKSADVVKRTLASGNHYLAAKTRGATGVIQKRSVTACPSARTGILV
ncbi:TPA: hypothetical protein N0F65_008525 [Lagenidium giganteum]|uniref:PH domain-containing protein n=1 Tax=Lagenidium giganteum TaxID=4803 RepID=A0AAV2Z615_9STRA|nr:TPA: hypothetical protein N0F65_008525 [Lagenidium giganteum]